MWIRNTIALTMAITTAGALAVGLSHPTAASAASLTAMPKGNVTSNGRTWKQVTAQDFTTPASTGTVLSKYPSIAAYDGSRDTSGRGLYAPSKVLSVHDGLLDFSLHSENGQPLVSSIMPDDYTAHSTGRISIRYKTTDTPGYKFVGMLWPSDDNWNEGEIDWPEGDLGSVARPASAIPGTMSNGMMTFDSSVQKNTWSKQSSDYHVATTEWDHGVVRFYWNGSLVSVTRKAVPTTPMRVTLQAETAITGAVPTSSSGHVYLDWVSIWE